MRPCQKCKSTDWVPGDYADEVKCSKCGHALSWFLVDAKCYALLESMADRLATRL